MAAFDAEFRARVGRLLKAPTKKEWDLMEGLAPWKAAPVYHKATYADLDPSQVAEHLIALRWCYREATPEELAPQD